MRKKIKRTLLLLTAMLFIVAGIAGLVLPFLQGILFLAIGIILLSLYSPSAREWLEKHTVKFPQLHRMIQKIEGWIVSIIGET